VFRRVRFQVSVPARALQAGSAAVMTRKSPRVRQVPTARAVAIVTDFSVLVGGTSSGALVS